MNWRVRSLWTRHFTSFPGTSQWEERTDDIANVYYIHFVHHVTVTTLNNRILNLTGRWEKKEVIETFRMSVVVTLKDCWWEGTSRTAGSEW